MKFEYFGVEFSFEEGHAVSVDYCFNDGYLAVALVNDGKRNEIDYSCVSFNNDGYRIFRWAIDLFFVENHDVDVFFYAVDYVRAVPRKKYSSDNFNFGFWEFKKKREGEDGG